MTTYDYDNVSRLTQIVQNLNGTANDLTLDFTLNPAGQIAANTRSNTGYSFTGRANGSLATPADGLNRLSEIGGVETVHDERGNLTNDTAREFVYSAENRLRADSAGASQAYDPLGRLYFTYHLFADPPSSGTYLVSDGGRFVAELDVSTAVLRRYVFGPGIDEPLVWYEGSGLSGRRWLHADERGSVIAVSDGSGDLVGTRNRYDEYGNVQGTLTGRFGYTGQPFVPEFGLYYYRARIYNPALGRFMQADPIGYEAGMNLYAYALNDPVNFTDPSGLEDVALPPILVTGWNWSEWLRRFTTQTELRLLQRDFTRGNDASNESAGDDGAGQPFCDEPGADPFNCAPVVSGSLPWPTSSLTPTSLQSSSRRRAGNRRTGPHRCTGVSDNPGGADFSEACRRHDACYQTLGAPKPLCDNVFLSDMLDACNRAPSYSVCVTYAHFYYKGVQSLGLPAYVYEQGRAALRRFGR